MPLTVEMTPSFNIKLPNTSKFKEMGVTGLKQTYGYVYQDPNKGLVGVRKIHVYDEMMQDAIVGGVLYSIEALLLNVTWRVEPASKTAKDGKNAEFLESCMEDMVFSWKNTLREIYSYLRYGFACHEIVYKYRKGDNNDPAKYSKYNDGKIGWAKLPLRSQESILNGRWYFGPHGEILGAQQWAPPLYEKIDLPINKMLLFRTTPLNNNPEGVSILRSANRAYYFKKNMENIEAIGIERNLSGIPVIKAPIEIFADTASAGEKALLEQCKKIVTGLKRDEQAGVVMPQSFDADGNERFTLTLLSSPGTVQHDTSKIIQRYAMEIATSMLADFLLLGQSASGTQALATEKIEVFSTALSSWLGIVADEFNKRAVPQLFSVNGIKGELPKLVPGEITTKAINEFMSNLRNLAVSGLTLFPDNTLENFVREKLNLPKITTSEGEKRDTKAMEMAAPAGGQPGGSESVARPAKPRLKNRELSANSNKRNGKSDA
jgi:hypothetical protein